jgi:hypothetical protein
MFSTGVICFSNVFNPWLFEFMDAELHIYVTYRLSYWLFSLNNIHIMVFHVFFMT